MHTSIYNTKKIHVQRSMTMGRRSMYKRSWTVTQSLSRVL